MSWTQEGRESFYEILKRLMNTVPPLGTSNTKYVPTPVPTRILTHPLSPSHNSLTPSLKKYRDAEAKIVRVESPQHWECELLVTSLSLSSLSCC